jgi:Cu(I)/Ag(I) efflux system membrane fusion protein
MEQVRKGQALATIFAPEWLGPQNELLALKRSGVPQELITATREAHAHVHPRRTGTQE